MEKKVPKKNQKKFNPDVDITVDKEVLSFLRGILQNEEVNIDKLIFYVKKDLSLLIKVLEKSNSGFFTLSGMPETLSLTSGIMRIGLQDLLGLVNSELYQESVEKTPFEVKELIRSYKLKSCKVSKVSAIIAKEIDYKLINDVEIAGSFLDIGYIVAALNLKEDFLRLKNEVSRKMLRHKLEKEYDVNVEILTLRYLNKRGMPSYIVDSINRDKPTSEKKEYLIRSIIYGAKELVEAFDDEKIQKYEPGKVMPSSCTLKLLPFTKNGYQEAYDKVKGYLTMCYFEEQKKSKENGEGVEEENNEENKEENKVENKEEKKVEVECPPLFTF